MIDPSGDVGVVVIGRNEGERLKRCLASVASMPLLVYVDSGSTDGSSDHARSQGVAVVDLRSPPAFTAARGRNAGLDALLARAPETEFVQMIDGDCELAPGWIEAASQFLTATPEAAAVFGRLRERNPEASLYNRLCQAEWDGPLGPVASCGGIAMFRVAALRAAGGYADDLAAGEEPDLCLRLRRAGRTVVRIQAEMAVHDAALTRFGQYWTRAERGGHAFAELARRHGRDGNPKWRRQLLSIGVWAGAIPLAILAALGLAATGIAPAAWAAVALLLLYPIQVARMAVRRSSGLGGWDGLAGAGLLMLAKAAELRGALRFWWKRGRGRSGD